MVSQHIYSSTTCAPAQSPAEQCLESRFSVLECCYVMLQVLAVLLPMVVAPLLLLTLLLVSAMLLARKGHDCARSCCI
jgi:uncharacterized membrane protein YhaH (DUF805 family)